MYLSASSKRTTQDGWWLCEFVGLTYKAAGELRLQRKKEKESEGRKWLSIRELIFVVFQQLHYIVNA